MGISKRVWEEEQERGYRLTDGKTVCLNCFEESGIKQFIKENNTHSVCSYCENEKEISTCELDSLIEHILNSIRHEWGHPANEGIPYETREGGWQYENVYDTWDLLDEIGLENIHGEVFEDICNSIHNIEWCKRDPFSLPKDRTLLYGWLNFSTFVMRKSRYVFLKAKNLDYDEDQHDEMDPVEILDSLKNIINRLNLIKTIDTDTSIFRVRVVNPEKSFNTAKELGSPPYQYATMANRMSPAGIPMFYGAFDVETAIKETYEPCKEEKKAIIGVFKPVKNMKVVDLSESLPYPSLFDKHDRHKRDDISFLSDFITDFSKPIERQDKAHIDYVPTQIVTEYFRHIFKSKDGSEISGVIYPSSKNNGKKAIVLFASSKQCIDSDSASIKESMLRLDSVKTNTLERI